jgi:hypothetical protein
MMKQRFPNVKLIENKDNSGFPKGNNIGVAAAQGKYICILNLIPWLEDTYKSVSFRRKARQHRNRGSSLSTAQGIPAGVKRGSYAFAFTNIMLFPKVKCLEILCAAAIAK